MFHMLSSFNLKPGENLDAFCAAYDDFVDGMKAVGLVESSGPIGQRQSDTPMDTDDTRTHTYFTIMTFRDRTQVDAAYAFIMKHADPSDSSHRSVLSKVADPVFTCWQDIS